MSNQICFYLLVVLFAFQSCGSNISFTEEDLDKEIKRTDQIVNQAETAITKMKESYSPELVTKLSEMVNSLPLFAGQTEYSVPKSCQGKCSNQIDKINNEIELINDVLNEYQAFMQYSENFSDVSSNAESSVSCFLDGYDRKYYENALTHLEKLNTEELVFSINCLKERYDKIRTKEDSLFFALNKKLRDNEKNIRIGVFSDNELLLDAATIYPFYLNKSDVLYVSGSANVATEIRVWDANSKKLIKSFGKKSKYNEVLPIPNSSIYLVEFVVGTSTYFDLNISKSTAREYWDKNYSIKTESIVCNKNDFIAYPVTTVDVVNLFPEPRKITLRSGVKALFSGSTSSSVSLNIPENTFDVAYQLRISTSKGANSRDGQFCDNISNETKRIKILGVNLYESKKTSSSLIREILNNMKKPEKEEEAYCSMYVFYDAKQAKQFQEGTAASSLKYDVNYSIVGTQSTNGAIPITNAKNIYLSFANDKTTDSVYIWLEATAMVNVVTYWRTKYTLE